MKLKKLQLKNFKGILDFKLECDGENINIYGDNATGKTTVFDAIIWLLFDKNSENKTDFGIKPIINGLEMSKGEHEVHAEFDVDGRTIKLSKIYHEVWSKPRGKLNEEFKGNTSEYYVNDVPTKSNDYKKYISTLVEEGVFKLLTSPLYFNTQLSWQKRREIIMDVCGGISEADIVERNPELGDLIKFMGDKSIDELKKMLKAQLSKLNKDMAEIPIRISELQNSLGDTIKTSASDVLTQISIIKASINEVEDKIRIAKNSNVNSALLSEIEDLKIKANSIRQEDEKNFRNQLSNAELEKNDIYYKLLGTKQELEFLHKAKNQSESGIEKYAVRREELIKEFQEVSSRQFEEEILNSCCPTCGQAMPEEMLTAIREKQIEKAEIFRVKKAEKLQSINDQGKKLNAAKVDFENNLKKLNADIDEKNKEVAVLQKALESKTEYLNEVKNSVSSLNDNEQYVAIEKRIASLKEELANGKGSEDISNSLYEEMQSLQGKLATQNELLARINANKQTESRIKELLSEEKLLSCKHEELSKQLFDAETFVRAKVDMITEKINTKFKIARFVLFKNNLTNDGVEECCEATYNSVPFTDLNNAARINVGLDIIKTLADNYKFYPPIFIDNAESVTKFLDMGETQVIKLIVSEVHKKLEVEVA